MKKIIPFLFFLSLNVSIVSAQSDSLITKQREVSGFIAFHLGNAYFRISNLYGLDQYIKVTPTFTSTEKFSFGLQSNKYNTAVWFNLAAVKNEYNIQNTDNSGFTNTGHTISSDYMSTTVSRDYSITIMKTFFHEKRAHLETGIGFFSFGKHCRGFQFF